jgi:ribulose-5-phosphate 4-epimerase/fuculose-1-phosphate aldolase
MSEQQALFEDLVDANHILYNNGIVDGYGHVSVRHPDHPDRFVMAAAVSPGRVRDTDLISLDFDGKVIGEERPTYSERFIHAEIYRARSDVNAVIHSHSPTVIPFSVTDVPLRAIIHGASFMQTAVPVFNTHDVPEATTPLVNSPAIGKALVKTLGQSSIVLMRGHGNTVVAGEIREVVSRAIYAERNAMLLLQTLALGRPIVYMNAAEAKAMQGSGVNPGRGSSHGVDRVWQMWVDEVHKDR